MGLDISGKVFTEFKGDPKEAGETFVLRGFERSLLPEEIVKIDYENENYKYVNSDFGMSYGSYNGFRRELAKAALGITIEEVWDRAAKLADDEPYPEAIYHILNFADNEGYIGPTAVKALKGYFLANHDRIRKHFVDQGEEGEWNLTGFDRLVKCVLKTAAENGYLDFA